MNETLADGENGGIIRWGNRTYVRTSKGDASVPEGYIRAWDGGLLSMEEYRRRLEGAANPVCPYCDLSALQCQCGDEG